MVLTFTPISPAVLLIVALSSTTISIVTSAIHSSTDIEGKVYSHNTSYLQYTDIFRDVQARLLRNGMSSLDLDNLISEINARMGLIEDFSLPICLFVFFFLIIINSKLFFVYLYRIRIIIRI
jgi:hypothetical protein